MADLLIHSMSEFRDIILEALNLADARSIVEIGAEYGGMSTLLADHAGARGGRLTSIDPAPKPQFLDWVASRPDVEHVASTSLSVILDMTHVDAWVVDGDHNWFTVYHELQAIEAVSRRDGKPMLVFLHDVCWPCGARDAYYAPDQIPEHFRQPYSYSGGSFPGHSQLVPNRGFRGMGHWAAATHEGGPRNGVRAAVEDFVNDVQVAGGNLGYAEVPAVFGLGVLFDLEASWSKNLAQLLAPYHDNRLLRSLEENRLANYLQVLELKDAESARAA